VHRERAQISEFYRTLFGLEPITGSVRADGGSTYGGTVDFVSDGAVEFHLARRDVELGFRMKHFVNPLDRGHSCFRTDDIDGSKRRLDEKMIPYSDCGVWAIKGWHQIFFHDPDGNIIEVHQTGR
jgi:catechol 2,3-dioxygenase-like lactoylglutathione lyase family enzyme